MEPIRKINDDLSIAGQITPEQLKKIALEGYQSVLDLRSPDEVGRLENEQQFVELLGLHYVNLPLPLQGANRSQVQHILYQVERLEKPLLIHCSSAERSAAISLLAIAIRQGQSLKQALKQVEKFGLLTIQIEQDELTTQYSNCQSS